MLVNTQEFRKEALYFSKHGKYDCGEKGTRGYKLWWQTQKERCLYGYSVGGMWIPGLYYSYLNFNQIEIVEKIKGSTRSGNRRVEFPKFWDVDYTFFMSIHIAKYGISLEDYLALPISLGLKTDERNLSGGHHLFWDKTRGVGASWKASSIASRNFHHIPNSKTYMFADDDEFLIKDGLFSKFLFHRTFLNNHTEFKVSTFKADSKDMHYISGYDAGGRNIQGLKSEVIGVPVAGNPNKVRGKRGSYILWEEFGNFRRVMKAWEVSRHSLEEGGIMYGTNIAFGTGGTESEAADHMEDFALNPRAYNLLAFDNQFDKDLIGTDCTLFTPADRNIQYTDEDGNSDLVLGNKFVQEQYDEARVSKDPKKLTMTKAELPLNILDSLMSVSNNKFAVEGLEAWKNRFRADPSINKLPIPKELKRDSNGKIIAEFNPDLKPVVKYPHRQDDDVSGCVMEYATPYTNADGTIPDDLYYICCDPYAEDDAEDITSLGAAYVMMNFNNIVPGDVGDRIVASFVGRRRTTLEYSDILFMLSERWNAPICIEQDRGTIAGDAKLRKKEHLLVQELSLSFDENIATKNPSKFKYGVRISSGRFNPRMMQGDSYIVNWLQTERETTQRGVVHNFNLIYDLGLLEELTKYRQGEGNYDRISALRIGMFYGRQLIYDNKTAKKSNPHKVGKISRVRQRMANEY